ncbi:hypothetical protein ABD76_00555 [Paenibacillus dendritiformis]|uniref:hypothetical protein n=1 Tax=Paenibacillus dendritiformis TaxID=130049 RepID=UPI0018CE3D93|nr:hypothetical protein [Paenibacillus dendritiformis]MBG9791101.1 hypothetical protein [Paenibacillus dendritiformis]
MYSKTIVKILIIVCMMGLIFQIADRITRDRYDVITDTNIEEVVAKEGIKILAETRLNDLDKPLALLFYEKDNEIGSFDITVVNGETNYVNSIKLDRRKERPVEFLGAKGEVTYVMILINDTKLLKEGEKLVVKFSNASSYSTEIVPHVSNYIITHDRLKNREPLLTSSDISIYSKEGDIIYHNK